MASTEETFREAVQQMFGDKWEITEGAFGGMKIYCRTMREIPESWFRASRANPGAFLDRVRSLMLEMVGEIDPGIAHREREHEADRERIRTLEAELAGAKAIIADLFRQARGSHERENT